MSETNLTAGQEKFLDQYTRKKMVDWCHCAFPSNVFTVSNSHKDEFGAYLDHAVSKKWLSPQGTGRDIMGENHTYKVLSAGWATASAFLKR